MAALGGGVLVGGTADVDIVAAPFDGFLAVWFLLEDASGVTDEFLDSSGNQYHGTGGAGVAEFCPTQIESLGCLPAQEFEGRQFITVPVVPCCAVSCWVRIDSWHEDRTIFSRPGLRLGYTVLRQPYLVVTDGETTSAVYSTVALAQDRWYHLAAAWTPGSSLAVYVDGVLAGTASTSITTLQAGTAAFIGRQGAGGFPSIGLMDLRLYPAAQDWLAEKEVLCPGVVDSVGNPEGSTYS